MLISEMELTREKPENPGTAYEQLRALHRRPLCLVDPQPRITAPADRGSGQATNPYRRRSADDHFLVDFTIRLVSAPLKSRYFFGGGGWLDLIGSLPTLRIFRLFRVLRVSRLVLQVNAVTAEGMDTLQLPEDIERVRHIVEVYDVALIVLDP
jgi:hypothetical protein